MTRKPWTRSEIEIAKAGWIAGHSVPEIAARLPGRIVTAVTAKIHALGLPPRPIGRTPRSQTDEAAAEFRTRWMRGDSTIAMGRDYGVAPSSISRRAATMGLVARGACCERRVVA